MAKELDQNAKDALEAAKILKAYCTSLDMHCTDCVFDLDKSGNMWSKSCLLNDSIMVPEDWDLKSLES